MNSAQRELFEGLGLAVLAWLVTGALLYGAFVALGKADWVRLVPFGALGLFGLYWSTRFTRSQFATYAVRQAEARHGP